ncbi:SCO family protein [candidate division KSB1 bacterium]|nr:SCO family protein [candidate division KSB1 bacterium]RQW00481.1 MAG: SCO family protein [candidate division KSB1 bacterium]
MSTNSLPKGFVFGIIFAFLLAVGAALVISAAHYSRANLPVLGSAPDFTLTERSGEPFSSEDMRGTLWLVDFIFTHCQAACPVMSGHMAELYKLYAHSDKIRFLSISVDPERDTMEVLQDYADKQGVTDNRWMFVRGEIDYIIEICEQGFMLPAENLPMGHSTKFVLVDQVGQIRGYYDALDDPDIDVLKTHIRELARQMK